VRVVGAAEAAAEQARMDVYATAGQGTLLALAVRDAAGSLPAVQNLTITPDLLTGVLSTLVRGLGPDDGPAGAGTAGKAA